MDRKRKSVFSPCASDRRQEAQVKKRSHSEHDRFISQPSSCDFGSENDTRNLRYIVDQLTKMLHTGYPKPSEGVLQAAAALNRSLQHTPVSTTPSTSLTGNELGIIKNPTQDRGISSSTLPPLPSITDISLERTVFTLPAMSSDPTTTFPEISSGRISQIRESLVKNETLADYTTKYGLDRRVSFPRDYLNQPKRLIKTKGDLFEAYVAAVVLSQPNGYSVVEEWLSRLWIGKLEAFEEPSSHMHAKEDLAKRVLRRKGMRLNYIDEGPPIRHEGGTQTFFIGVYLTGPGLNNRHLGSGQGLNKAVAGNKAAQEALRNVNLMNEIVSIINTTHGPLC
ncbi:hypothetical protein BJX64DRAFT_264356 [Aspergillus heterothallicus]